jgi:hypothetical protein
MTNPSGKATDDPGAELTAQPSAELRGSAGAPRSAAANRGRRVILLLIMLWVLNGFDLYFTIMAGKLPHFNETNPLAASLFEHPYALSAFKIGAVAFASTVLILFRQRRLAEFACWCVCMVYVVVSITWLTFFMRYTGAVRRWSN